MRARLPVLPLLLVLLTLGGIGCIATAVAQAGEAERERRLWHLAKTQQTQLERSVPMVRDAALDRFLNDMADTLFARSDSALPPVRVRVLRQVAPDARAYPNGAIYLTTGMLAHARNQDQLAMILAHEIIHYTARHAQKALGALDDASTKASTAFHSAFTSSQRHDRKQIAAFVAAAEKQADSEGLWLMQAAGYCPAEVIPLMDAFRSRQAANDDGQDETAVLEARIELLAAQVQQAKPCAGVSATAIAYQVRVAPALLANAQAGLEAGAWDVVGDSIDRYLTVRPDDPHAHYLRGELHSRTAPGSDAGLADYQQAIALDNGFAPAHKAIGLLHFKAQRFALARNYLETSLALAPRAPDKAFIEGYIAQCH